MEKPDSKSAAGTLLMTWEARTLMRISRPESAAESQEAKAGILPRFPMKIKKCEKRGEQGIIDLCQHFFICDQCAQKDEDKDCRVGKHMQNGKEAEEKQNDVKPDQRRLFFVQRL